jgi:hypothetical protein
LVKEFDRELKDGEARNSPQVNKQLNDEKQSMVSLLLITYNNLCVDEIYGGHDTF